MKATLKKTLRISLITLGALIVLLTSAIALAINFVFTPEKLTPVVVKAANQSLHARLDLDAVELTFFSTFPRFGLKLTDGTLVSKAIRDTLWERPDTLASFRRAVLVINPIDYLKQQKITLHRLALDSAKIYAISTRTDGPIGTFYPQTRPPSHRKTPAAPTRPASSAKSTSGALSSAMLR